MAVYVYSLKAMAKAGPLTQTELHEVAFGCACLGVRRTARSVTRLYDDALGPSGLTITQMSLLVAAELAGSATVGQLADVLGLERTTVTRDLRPLRDRRLVDIGVGEDRRARAIALTDAGREALADALPRWRSAQEKVMGDERVPSWPELADTLMSLDAAARE